MSSLYKLSPSILMANMFLRVLSLFRPSNHQLWYHFYVPSALILPCLSLYSCPLLPCWIGAGQCRVLSLSVTLIRLPITPIITAIWSQKIHLPLLILPLLNKQFQPPMRHQHSTYHQYSTYRWSTRRGHGGRQRQRIFFEVQIFGEDFQRLARRSV